MKWCGLGKTTLACHLFEHQANEGSFDGKKIWICVSENFNVVMILKEMVESITNTRCALKNKDTIIGELQEKLKGKRLFLVLDDVWNEKEQLWDSLKSKLKRIGVLAGSVILITTRSYNVAKTTHSSYEHNVEGLSKDDGWALLN
ncbi:putative disease resistance protein RGA3 [Bienertia sinuspersici]